MNAPERRTGPRAHDPDAKPEDIEATGRFRPAHMALNDVLLARADYMAKREECERAEKWYQKCTAEFNAVTKGVRT